MPRRSYDQYCAVARTLDTAGERWTLLVVRELLTGPRRYTDLHADLPGVSTDVLASRLRDMERDGLVARHRLSARGTASAYALTQRGRALAPVLRALAEWGAPALRERRPTDAFRAHWLAAPLVSALEGVLGGAAGVLDVHLETGAFSVEFGAGEPGGVRYFDVAAGDAADARLDLAEDVCAQIAAGDLPPAAAVSAGAAAVAGDSPLADALRSAGSVRPAAAEPAP
ncbi:winged helix-turn-helix transcriptional regulator [Nocardiopsis coralliicola]